MKFDQQKEEIIIEIEDHYKNILHLKNNPYNYRL